MGQGGFGGGQADADLAFIFKVGDEFCLQLNPVRLGYLHAVSNADGGVSGNIQRSC